MIGFSCFVIALGVWFLASALANWEWYKSIVDFAAAEAVFGEGATRWLCGAVGLAFIGVGVAALAGAL
ncbi:MAG TPA: hypothetical protein VIL46_18455 [Gemmataceae bacterium]